MSPLAFGSWLLAKSQELKARSGLLPLQQIHFVHVNRLLVTEEGDQDTEANGGFGGGVGDYKNREHLAVQGAGTTAQAGWHALPVARESHQVQVHGIQD